MSNSVIKQVQSLALNSTLVNAIVSSARAVDGGTLKFVMDAMSNSSMWYTMQTNSFICSHITCFNVKDRGGRVDIYLGHWDEQV